MITPLLVGLVLLDVQTKDGQWGKSDLTPTALAKKADDKLANLSKAMVTYTFAYVKNDRTPNRETGFATCEATIISPNKYWLQVPNLDRSRRESLNFETWISDGKRFGRGVQPDVPVPGPLSARPAPPAKPGAAWFTDCSRVIFSGLGRPTRPFQSLLTDLGRQGFKATTNFRTYTMKGRRHPTYRLVALKGNVRYETIFDGYGWVPISVMNTIGTQNNSRWADVKWQLKPGKNLDPSVVRFKKAGAVRELVPARRLP